MDSINTLPQPADANTITSVIQLNPVTGQMEAVPVEQAAALEAKPSPEAKPSRAYFGQAKGYTSTVYLDGHAVYISVLSKQDYAEYAERERAITTEMLAIQKDGRKDDADPGSIANRSDAVADAQDALYAWVVERAVKGWALPDLDGTPMPYSEELRAAMPVDIRCELSNYILQKSRLGRDESSFLG